MVGYMKYEHKWFWCTHCDWSAVRCGQCGLNTCSCGSNCDACDDANNIDQSGVGKPFRFKLREFYVSRIKTPIWLIYNRL